MGRVRKAPFSPFRQNLVEPPLGRLLDYAIDSSCTIMVYTGVTMALTKRSRAKSTRLKHVRRSVTLPPKIARQVEALAKERDLSDNRVLIELIEQGIEARQQKEKAFFQLAERFRAADDPEQVKQLGDQLGRFVFGE
jgi:predicted DNA-binding ribbon-helix-helix protein